MAGTWACLAGLLCVSRRPCPGEPCGGSGATWAWPTAGSRVPASCHRDGLVASERLWEQVPPSPGQEPLGRQGLGAPGLLGLGEATDEEEDSLCGSFMELLAVCARHRAPRPVRPGAPRPTQP